jgi:hypothetical protein
MASGGNPLMGGGGGGMGAMLPIILGALTKRTQDASASGAAPMAGQMAQNQGADDGMVLQQLNDIHKALGLVFVRTMENRPNVANNISATMKALSRAIKEAQQGANVGEVVGQTEAAQPKPPINFSAAAQGQSPDFSQQAA